MLVFKNMSFFVPLRFGCSAMPLVFLLSRFVGEGS